MVRFVRVRYAIAVASAVLALSPVAAWAQSGTTGSIAGEVKDTTGAVLPGVTVEASSPALIEKVRTVVTDDAGRYGPKREFSFVIGDTNRPGGLERVMVDLCFDNGYCKGWKDFWRP